MKDRMQKIDNVYQPDHKRIGRNPNAMWEGRLLLG
jgi:hypothetical protein